jgi:hypothetical protein
MMSQDEFFKFADKELKRIRNLPPRIVKVIDRGHGNKSVVIETLNRNKK